tara:strand:+ start:12173 stop:14824 length:2652 start_codon:yes stop_codon:yes gene_type:complete
MADRAKGVDVGLDKTRVGPGPFDKAKTESNDASPRFAHGSNTKQDAGSETEDLGLDETLEAPPDTATGLDATADAAFSSPSSQDFKSLSTVEDSNYVLGREIARGGMGRIVQARDLRLGRAVAIKELLLPSPSAEQRFEREMMITGRLQHPAIIGVLEAGRWPSGNPFYTMKHIDGRPLDAVIESQKTFADRLALLPRIIAVVDALAYAHAQRVIHRDLKPANVLVGSYGETIVIDWGLAKDLNRASMPTDETSSDSQDGNEQLTILGRAMGTPAYMPPEQARGAEVNERADVYSLGALLYHLLSGQMPYTGEKSAQAILARVRKEAPRPLEELSPDVPIDLLSIVQKAMERDASARYSSAQELATDLRRFESGQRVGVHEYSVRTIIRRWVARHRTAVVSSLFLVTVLIAFAAWSFHSLALERDAVAGQRDQAESNRAESEDLVTFMVQEMSSKLKPIGQLSLLELVAERAGAYYDRRDIDWTRASDVRNRATSLENLGSVSQGLGNLEVALDRQRAALALRQRLTTEHPESVRWGGELAHAQMTLGKLLHTSGNHEEAVRSYEVALSLLEDLESQEPSSLFILSQKSLGHELLAKARYTASEYEEALEQFELSLSTAQHLGRVDPNAKGRQSGIAVGHEDLSSFFVHMDRPEEALPHAQASLEIRETMARREPENTQVQRDLSVSHNDLGDVFMAQNLWKEAVAQFRISLGIGKRLSESDPLNSGWKRDLALNYYKMGSVFASTGNAEEAGEHYDKALVIFEELSEKDPTNYRWKSDLAVMNTKVGSFHLSRDMESARIYFGRAAQLYSTFAKAPSDVYDAACCFALIGDVDQAFMWLGKSVAMGGTSRAQLESDETLQALHDDPRWKALLERQSASTKPD